MRIRPARNSDLKEVTGIYDEGYEEIKTNPDFGDVLRAKRPSPERKKEWAAQKAREMRHGDTVFMVAEERGVIAGFCFVKKMDTPDSEMSHVGVLDIRVRQGYRNLGIGTRLMAETLKRCRGRFEILELFPLRINSIAIAMYRKFGFRTWGVAPGFVKRGKKYIDMEHMYLKL